MSPVGQRVLFLALNFAIWGVVLWLWVRSY